MRTMVGLIASAALIVSLPALGSSQDSSSASPNRIAIAGPVLMVSDLERSLKFYIDGLGMKLASRLPGNPGPGAVVTAGDAATPFLLLRQRAKEAGSGAAVDLGDGLDRVMLVVPDVQAAAQRLVAAGYAHDPISKTRIFFARDPDGYRFEVMERSSRH